MAPGPSSDNRLSAVLATQRQIVSERERELGEEHPDTVMSMETLARIYQYLGDGEKAKRVRQELAGRLIPALTLGLKAIEGYQLEVFPLGFDLLVGGEHT